MFFKAKTRMAHVKNNKRQDEENLYNSWNFAADYEKIRGRNPKSRLGRRKIGENPSSVDVKNILPPKSGIPVRPSGFSIGKNTTQSNLKLNVQNVLNMPFNLYNYKKRSDNHGFKTLKEIQFNEKSNIESILNKSFTNDKKTLNVSSSEVNDEFMTCVPEQINLSRFQSSFCLLKTPGKQLTSRRSDDSPLDPLAGISDDEDDIEKTIFSVKSGKEQQSILSPKNAEFLKQNFSDKLDTQSNFFECKNIETQSHKKDQILTPSPCTFEREQPDDKKTSDTPNIEKLNFFGQNSNNLLHKKDQILTQYTFEQERKTSDTPNVGKLNYFSQNTNLPHKQDQIFTPSADFFEPEPKPDDKKTSDTLNIEKFNLFSQNPNFPRTKDQILTQYTFEQEHKTSDTPNVEKFNFFRQNPINLPHKKDQISPSPYSFEQEHKLKPKEISDTLNIEKLNFFKQNTNLPHIKDQMLTPSTCTFEQEHKTSDTSNVGKLNFFKQNTNLPHKKDQLLTPSTCTFEQEHKTSGTSNVGKLNFFKQNTNLPHKKDQILTPSTCTFEQEHNSSLEQEHKSIFEQEHKTSGTSNVGKLNFFKQNTNLPHKKDQILTPSTCTFEQEHKSTFEQEHKTSDTPNVGKLNFFRQNPSNLPHKKDQILTPSTCIFEQEHKSTFGQEHKTSDTPNVGKLNFFRQTPSNLPHKKEQILTPSTCTFEQEHKSTFGQEHKTSDTPNVGKLNFFKQNTNLPHKEQILTPSTCTFEQEHKTSDTSNAGKLIFFKQNKLPHKEQILTSSTCTFEHEHKTSDTPNLTKLNFFSQKTNLPHKKQILTSSKCTFEQEHRTSKTPNVNKINLFSQCTNLPHIKDQILTPCTFEQEHKTSDTPNVQKLNFLRQKTNLAHRKDDFFTPSSCTFEQKHKRDDKKISDSNEKSPHTFEKDELTMITPHSELNLNKNIVNQSKPNEHEDKIFTPSPYTFEKPIFQDNENTLISPLSQKLNENDLFKPKSHKNQICTEESLFKPNMKKQENPPKNMLTPPYTQKITERSNFVQNDFPFQPLSFNTKTREDENILYVNKKPYIVLTVLGKGGSSQVYKVLDEQHNTVAVKCVNLDNVEDVIANGYLNEIKLLAKLQDCETVIRMYDYEFVRETKKLNVVMEIGEIDFSKLLKNVETTKNISVAMIIYYWSEMLAAVQEIHERGIIHSDLKPANFLIVKGRLKLIDFGISSSLQGDMTSVFKEITTGTYNYMSPEAISYSGEIAGYKITYKSDIWSLGCILYNLLYGQTPFSHIKNTLAKLRAIADPRSKIIFPNDQKTPVHLLIAMRLCFVRDPKLRPSASELIQILELPTSKSSLTRQIDMFIFEELKHAFPNLSEEITQLENEIKGKNC